MNPAIVKRRKKLRHLRHKREAVKYLKYLHSKGFDEDLKKKMHEFINNQKDLPSEFVKIVDEHFYELLY